MRYLFWFNVWYSLKCRLHFGNLSVIEGNFYNITQQYRLGILLSYHEYTTGLVLSLTIRLFHAFTLTRTHAKRGLNFVLLYNEMIFCVEMIGSAILAILALKTVYNIGHFFYSIYFAAALGRNINPRKYGPWAGKLIFHLNFNNKKI